MTLSELEALLRRLAGLRVVTVGDVMIDRFIYGEVSRVSAEAPIPVLARTHASVMLGGCANVARNVAALGGTVCLVGAVGGDEPGREARDLVAGEPRIEDGLVTDLARPTTVKMRFVSAGQQLLRVDDEIVASVQPTVEDALAGMIARAAKGAGAILLSDYGKGVVTQGVIDACQAAATENGAVLIVDSKARGFAQYGLVDVIKPNAGELSWATDMPTDSDSEVEAALEKALGLCQARAILVTRAARGMSLAVRGEPIRHFSRPSPEVFDTSGAGDTALAALGLALGAGASLNDAAELALIASRVVVQKAGTATANPDDIVDAEAMLLRSPHESKIVNLEGMARQAERWRARGLRVGFTNGCFDILHPGHVAYLNQARGWCDRLIVGLNTDDSIRALKGPGRPVNSLPARASVLAGLSAVDLVSPFAEPTPISLILAARPDLLVKGGDYGVDGVVGGDAVRGWGGEVRIAAFVSGHSTSDTIRRMTMGEGL